jgi:release factor glutamine methyltransferase
MHGRPSSSKPARRRDAGPVSTVAEQALDLTRKAAAVFTEHGFDKPRLEAELLLAGVLGVGRLDLYLQHDRPVTAAELERYRVAVRRRLRREPLQYVLGTAAFRQLELHVDPRVLIPRPETEVLVGLVLDWSAAQRSEGGSAARVLDVGTGSGAIALSLAAEGEFERVVAVDVSIEALAAAQANAARLGLADDVEFRAGTLFDAVAGERFDIIVSNPPYVAESERAELAPEVRDHEPALALFGGPDGLAVVNALVAGTPPHLRDGGLLALEIGVAQGDAVLGLMRATGAYRRERIVDDLTGRPRFALAERVAE